MNPAAIIFLILRHCRDLILLLGRMISFFIADAFKPLMRAVTDKGQYHMIQNRGHLNLFYAPETLRIIKRHLATG